MLMESLFFMTHKSMICNTPRDSKFVLSATTKRTSSVCHYVEINREVVKQNNQVADKFGFLPRKVKAENSMEMLIVQINLAPHFE